MEVAMEKLGLNITVDEIKSYETIQAMAEYVESRQNWKENKILIEPVEPFNDLFFRDCQFNMIFTAVKYFGGNIGYFLANDQILYYCHTDKENEQEFGVQYKSFWKEKRVYAACGIFCTAKIKVQDVIGEAKEAIKSGKLVSLWIDSYYESMRKDVYQKEHLPHSILLHGYDDKKEIFHIIEHSNKDKLDYKHITISYNELATCYHGYLEYFIGAHREKTYFTYEGQHSIEKVSVFQLMKENIAYNRNELIGSVNKLKEIIEWIRKVVLSEELLKSRAASLVEMMNQIINAIKVEKYRLEYFAPESQEIVVQLDELATRWEKVRAWIGKYKLTFRYQEKTIEVILELLEQIAHLEQKRIWAILKKWGR